MTRHIRAISAALASVLLLGAAPTSGDGPATDAPREPDAVASAAAWWTDQQFAPDGSVLGRTGEPDVGTTIAAVLGVLATEHEPTRLAESIAFVEDNLEGYVRGDLGDLPGQIANAIVFTLATGGDPRAVGGQDLVARLEATEQRFPSPDAGRFGSRLDLFGQSYSHATAVLALALTPGVDPTATSVEYLLDLQCTGGGFPSGYVTVAERLVDRCTGDTNTSGLAAAALSRVVASGDTSAAVAEGAVAVEQFLVAARNDDGGWGFSPAGTTDGNSTGLAAFGLAALGGDRVDAPATRGALRGLQLGCDAGADAGGLRYQATNTSPDRFATFQGMLAFDPAGLSEVIATAQQDGPAAEVEPFPMTDPCEAL